MYKFNFWKFRGDVIPRGSYVDLAVMFDCSPSTLRYKMVGDSEIKLNEFVHWCNCLELNPMDYIEEED